MLEVSPGEKGPVGGEEPCLTYFLSSHQDFGNTAGAASLLWALAACFLCPDMGSTRLLLLMESLAKSLKHTGAWLPLPRHSDLMDTRYDLGIGIFFFFTLYFYC